MNATGANEDEGGRMRKPRSTIARAETLQSRFHDLLDRHEKIVFKVASTYCHHPEDRRDLAQEISLQLWLAFPRYDESRSFSTWMYRIALNVAISFARRAGRREMQGLSREWEVGDPEGSPEDLHERDERVAALRDVIDRLDGLNRAILLLYLEEHSYREIAEVLGITETNVATKISRLKGRIRDELA
jgi:RNA polymerase sigma factor (sigma-70 family)